MTKKYIISAHVCDGSIFIEKELTEDELKTIQSVAWYEHDRYWGRFRKNPRVANMVDYPREEEETHNR